MSNIETAHKLKKIAFDSIDKGKGGTVRINANDLIDVCLALEEASSGNYFNLEFSNAINHAQYCALRKILNKISDIAVPDSEIWDLCFSEYKPEFNVDPDKVLASLEGKNE